MPYLISFVFFLVLTGLSHATPIIPVVLTNQLDHINPAPQLEILEDPSRQLKIHQVSSPQYAEQFHPNTQNSPNFGRTRSAFWMRFKLENQSDLKWYARINAVLGKDVSLYVLTSTGQIATDNIAKHIPNYGLPVWSLTLPKQEPLQFYLRATNGDSILNLPIELFSSDAFLEQTRVEHNIFSSIIAAILIMAGYNLFLFFTIRENSYITLVIHILSMAAIIHIIYPVYNGFGFLRDTDSHFLAAPMYVMVASLLLYCRQLLHTHQNLPRLDQAMQWLTFASIVLLFITGWIPRGTLLAQFCILSMFTLVIIASIARSLQGYRIARYFLLIFLLMTFLIAPDVIINAINEKQWQSSKLYSTGLATLLFPLFLSVVQSEKVREWREQKQRAETAREATNNFLTTISHELRTPMHAVIGINELLKGTSSDHVQKDYINKLEAASRHMLGLINDILNLARMDKDQQLLELNNEPFNLEVLTDELDKLFSISSTQKGLELKIRIMVQPCPPLCADVKRLKQILVNLLSNAINYTDKGSIKLSIFPHRDNTGKAMLVHFEISDTGIGIPLDQQAYLFQPFYQIDNGTTRPRGGSGLGLSISYQLVKQMGGELQLESKPNEGSRFFFTLRLPIHADSKKAPVHTQSEPPAKPDLNTLQGIRILLVDDEALNLFIGKELLAAHGAQVILANTGKEAINQVQRQAIDLILMDVSMPDMSGYEATQFIRNIQLIPQPPIIALTAHAISGERERCLNAGMDDYLTKPFTIESLIDMILKHHPQTKPMKTTPLAK